MSEDDHAILNEGLTADCHLEDNAMDCGNASGCSWETISVDNRPTEVCLYDDQDYIDAFTAIAVDLIGACEGVADTAGIDPYPCEDFTTEGACENNTYCTWNAGACEFNFDTCTNAAFLAVPFSNNETCFAEAGQCELSGGTDTEAGLPDPSGVITQVSSTEWEIDQGFFDDMMADPSQLLNDNARIVESQWGDFRFQNVEEGSVAYELGFRSGDIIIKIDTYYLGTLENILIAWEAVKDNSSWTVKIQRSTVYYDFDYELI